MPTGPGFVCSATAQGGQDKAGEDTVLHGHRATRPVHRRLTHPDSCDPDGGPDQGARQDARSGRVLIVVGVHTQRDALPREGQLGRDQQGCALVPQGPAEAGLAF